MSIEPQADCEAEQASLPLYDKIRLIIMGLPDPDGGISEGDMNDGLIAINKAFQDSGYMQHPLGIDPLHNQYDTRLMTGQEFYDRFVFEYKHEASFHKDSALTKEPLAAAKRAAGLGDN